MSVNKLLIPSPRVISFADTPPDGTLFLDYGDPESQFSPDVDNSIWNFISYPADDFILQTDDTIFDYHIVKVFASFIFYQMPVNYGWSSNNPSDIWDGVFVTIYNNMGKMLFTSSIGSDGHPELVSDYPAGNPRTVRIYNSLIDSYQAKTIPELLHRSIDKRSHYKWKQDNYYPDPPIGPIGPSWMPCDDGSCVCNESLVVCGDPSEPITSQYRPMAAFEYIPVNELTFFDLNQSKPQGHGFLEPPSPYRVEIPVDFYLQPNRRYWISIMPRYKGGPVSRWCLSKFNRDNVAKFGSTIGTGPNLEFNNPYSTCLTNYQWYSNWPGNPGSSSWTDLKGPDQPPQAGAFRNLNFQLVGKERRCNI